MNDKSELSSITDLCRREGIELRGDDGQPYCCGARMNVRGGILGPDYAECLRCGKAIGNMASPHVNGRGLPVDEWLETRGRETWARLDAPATGEEG